MEPSTLLEYKVELPLHLLNSGQYLSLARKVATQFHCPIVAADNNTITFQTLSDGFTPVDIISMAVFKKQATLTVKPYNEYYHDESRSRAIAAAFSQAMESVISEHKKADRNLHPMHREKYGALLPSKSYLVTPIIVYLNTLVFIVMILAGISPLHPTSESLFLWGGNFRPAVLNGDWWRLISYMVLHAGALHLLMNTYALLYIGMFLEPLMGKFRFAATYVLTGVCAGLMSITMHPSSVCIGASGAIFGMYGVFFSILTTQHMQKTLRKTLLRSILFFIVFNLMSGLQGNTDNAAHIGGLLSGIVIGYAYYRGIQKEAPISRQLVTTSIITVGVVLAGIGVIAALQSNHPLF